MGHLEYEHLKTGDVDNVIKGVERLGELARNARDYERILETAINALYFFQEGGRENYGGVSPRLGRISLSQFNCHEGPGKVNLEFTPPAISRWNRDPKWPIGVIDLRRLSISLGWDSSECRMDTREAEGSSDFPNELIRDTEKVMDLLGLVKEYHPISELFE
ncbi:hypothetical protein COU61_03515 [Candidatus Pacearchaeota archaeon CG10_big_fil_rev_8_21_14_0_10_35_13]|nr:MAG: hypothetical protein COU61_03515 [Candidatus Pacearchaeota archaeon CG10_big_fil_rev_8_21_14_0_10_35_13]